MAGSSSNDDVRDVIFDESEDAAPPKRKKAARRKSAAAKPTVKEPDDVAAGSGDDSEPAEPKPRRRTRRTVAADVNDGETSDRDSSNNEATPVQSSQDRAEQDRQERQDNREQEGAASDSDEDGRPRRRRRRRRRPQGGSDGGFNNNGGNNSNHQVGAGNSQSQRGGRRRRGRGGRDGGGRDGGRDGRDSRQGGRDRVRSVAPSTEVIEGTIDGVLEMHPKGYGFLRNAEKGYVAQESDPFVPSSLVEKYRLREGVMIRGDVGPGVRNQGPRLKEVELIDGMTPEEYSEVKDFDELTPITPHVHIRLETGPKPVTMRVMDMLTPVGKGQRALLVAPPRTGKTMLLQDIADAVSKNHPEMHLMVLLIDERPEEVTEMTRCVKGEVIASSMDRDVESHVRMSQLMIERAKRMAEAGKDVFILMDSITRMARAFNKWAGGGGGGGSRHSGTMSGGLHVKALDIPKKLFGTARQFDEGGSITIVATALIETGGRMDDVIFQEFKGTGNMELVLSRDLADRRIWPAIDITRSGTRHEEKLFAEDALDSVIMLRRSLISLSPVEAMETLTRTLERFPTNAEFLTKVKAIL
ncbi:MAG: transcription termination factor Rho [Planctomycetota bacterium]|nr:transcription termination factor Rho [Planctomycetota bacterium]